MGLSFFGMLCGGRQLLGEALINAIQDGNEQRVRELLSQGADANYNDPERFWPPLMAACMRPPKISIIKLLIQSGAKVSWAKEELAAVAAHQNDVELLRVLASKGLVVQMNSKGADDDSDRDTVSMEEDLRSSVSSDSCDLPEIVGDTLDHG